jgi:SAM-dependent methyltransferase
VSLNEETVKVYDREAASWASRRQAMDDHVPGGWGWDWIMEALAMAASRRILEVGSGTGQDADFMESLGYEVQRSDASRTFREMLAARQEKPVLALDVTKDPLPPGYGLIYASAVLHHLERGQARAFMSAARAAAPALAIATRMGFGQEVVSRSGITERYYCYWQPGELASALFAAGYQGAWVILKSGGHGTCGNGPWVQAVAW